MFFFRKRKTLAESGIFQGFTDWHCHILPGVDDGVQTMEEALQVLAFNEELGIREVWLTPHIMEDIPNTTTGLKARFEDLKSAYNGNIILHISAENMLDNLFEERLEQNDLLPLGKDGKNLLVETSYFNPPMNLNDILKRIQEKAIFPYWHIPNAMSIWKKKTIVLYTKPKSSFSLIFPRWQDVMESGYKARQNGC